MSGRTWADVEDDFALYLSITYSQDTARNYLHGMKTFGGGAGNLSQITHTDVERWYADTRKRLARNTADMRLFAVRCFYRWYIARGGAKVDPTATIKVRASDDEPTRAFTEGELRRLLKAAETLQEAAFLLVFIHSAARRSEVLAMQAEDIDWVRGEILIKKGKGSRARMLAPGKATMQALSLTLQGRRRGAVWLSQRRTAMKRTTADRYLKRIAERAGVIDASFHRFRTAFGDRFLEEDGSLDELQQIYGHSYISTTAHYAKRSRRSRALRRQRALADRFSLADRVAG